MSDYAEFRCADGCIVTLVEKGHWPPRCLRCCRETWVVPTTTISREQAIAMYPKVPSIKAYRWNPKDAGCVCAWDKEELCGICAGCRPEDYPPPKDALRGVTHYPLPTNEPRPIAKPCPECSRLTWQGSALVSSLCPRCDRAEMVRSRENIENMETYAHAAWSMGCESAPGLAARYPDATRAPALEADLVLCVDDGRWDD